MGGGLGLYFGMDRILEALSIGGGGCVGCKSARPSHLIMSDSPGTPIVYMLSRVVFSELDNLLALEVPTLRHSKRVILASSLSLTSYP